MTLRPQHFKCCAYTSSATQATTDTLSLQAADVHVPVIILARPGGAGGWVAIDLVSVAQTDHLEIILDITIESSRRSNVYLIPRGMSRASRVPWAGGVVDGHGATASRLGIDNLVEGGLLDTFEA